MKDEELTPWFPPTTLPKRKGFYQRSYSGVIGYSHWNGERWSLGCFNLENAQTYKRHPSIAQGTVSWRGLASKPKKD